MVETQTESGLPAPSLYTLLSVNGINAMNAQTFIEEARENAEEDIQTLERKNSDYADSEADPFRNFNMVERAGLCSTEKGIAVRMTDKMQRVLNLVDKDEAAVNDETMYDTLSDLRNYANILQIYLEDEKESSGEKEETIYLREEFSPKSLDERDDIEIVKTTPGLSKSYEGN